MAVEKRALLIGINYTGTPCALRGCVLDVLNIQAFLRTQGYGSITILRDDDPLSMPTCNRIIKELNSLMAWSCRGSSKRELFVHFSGHGTWIPDISKDESDHRDECIVPCDYKRAGVIHDDMLKSILAKIGPKVNAFFVFDCCHSGSMLDMPLVYADGHADFQFQGATDTESESCVLMLSGCTDKQTSADAYNVNQQKRWSGALTSALLHTLRTHGKVNIRDLMADVSAFLHGRFAQKPQLSSRYPINEMHTLPFFT